MLYYGGDDYHPLQHTSYHGLAMQETAAALGISQPTVQRRLKKAEVILKSLLTGGDMNER